MILSGLCFFRATLPSSVRLESLLQGGSLLKVKATGQTDELGRRNTGEHIRLDALTFQGSYGVQLLLLLVGLEGKGPVFTTRRNDAVTGCCSAAKLRGKESGGEINA